MRVPVSWLTEFCDPGLPVEELADLLTVGGLAVEDIHRPTGGVRGVTIGEVESVEKISGSDKLFLVSVSDGNGSHEIVCGASNYSPGDKVPAALPGAALVGPGGAAVEIGRKKLFGHVSNGMLASARELGIGDDHRGIWVLDRDAPVGADLSEWLTLDDPVLELDVTPDRGYGLSILGVARDVAALTGAELRLPDAVAPGGGEAVVPVDIAAPDRCRRFDGRTIRGVQLSASPAWLQRRLAAAGMRPVSNIVDATNYAMLETGNPIHAYDLALLAGPRIEVRTARAGERLVTLDGVERQLHPDDLLICDADGPVALAGVMGGEATEINDGTTDVFLEVANFTARTVLRTARRHRLHTEGSSRWEKSVPPEHAPLAATRCAELITRYAGGVVVGGSDTFPSPIEREAIRLRPARARMHLGADLADDRQAELLRRIWCEVTADGDGLAVIPPAYRPDLQQEADLYEELARLHGYNRIPQTLPSTGQAGRRTPPDAARRAVRQALAGAGWTEALSFPFIADDELVALGFGDDDPRRRTVGLVNPLSQEQAVLRTTMLPSVLRVVRHNVNRQVPDVTIFEVGHVFLPPTESQPGAAGGPDGVALPAEPMLLGLAACGAFERPRHDRPPRQADLYDLLGAADIVRRVVGADALDVEPTDEAPYHPGRAARLRMEGQDIGVVGELHPRVAAALEVPARTLVGELRLDRIVARGIRAPVGRAPSPLPGIRFDVAIVVAQDVPAAAVAAAVSAGAGEALSGLELFDVYTGASIGEGRKSLAFRVRLDAADRQLTDADEANAIDGIEGAVAERVNGRLRR